jgi:ankyrin repeat protein
MIALDNQHNDVAMLLMDKGANLNVWDWWGRTALWIAVDRKAPPGGGGGGGGFGGGGGGRGGGGGGVGRGGRGGPDAGARGNLSVEAAAGGLRPVVSSMDIIKAQLDAGVDPNQEMNFHRPNAPNRGRFQDNQISTNTTPLFRAVQNNDKEVIQALLAKGADPNINTMGFTAFLLAAGAGPNARGGNAATNQANTEIMDLLIQHSADVNAKVTGTLSYSFNVSYDPQGSNHGVNSKEGTSALHEAARSVRTDMVKYLLAHGADPNLLDVDGKKPIDVIGVQRGGGRPGPAPAAVAAGGEAPAQAQAVAAPAAPAGGRGGAGRGGAGRGGANPAAVAEIRAMLEAAATKK